MGHVVFLRGVNVGGKNVFRPAELVKALARLDVVNVGAAGTFVVRGKASASEIRRAILAELPFEPALAIVRSSEVLALVASRPFAGARFSKRRRGWVAVMDAKPRLRPKLPIVAPAGRAWQVRLERVQGRFALGLWQRGSGGFVFPGHVVERALGPSATTRWWETLEKVAAILGPR
jgi:uncharacterized protein (DUF1697 family)